MHKYVKILTYCIPILSALIHSSEIKAASENYKIRFDARAPYSFQLDKTNIPSNSEIGTESFSDNLEFYLCRDVLDKQIFGWLNDTKNWIDNPNDFAAKDEHVLEPWFDRREKLTRELLFGPEMSNLYLKTQNDRKEEYDQIGIIFQEIISMANKQNLQTFILYLQNNSVLFEKALDFQNRNNVKHYNQNRNTEAHYFILDYLVKERLLKSALDPLHPREMADYGPESEGFEDNLEKARQVVNERINDVVKSLSKILLFQPSKETYKDLYKIQDLVASFYRLKNLALEIHVRINMGDEFYEYVGVERMDALADFLINILELDKNKCKKVIETESIRVKSHPIKNCVDKFLENKANKVKLKKLNFEDIRIAEFFNHIANVINIWKDKSNQKEKSEIKGYLGYKGSQCSIYGSFTVFTPDPQTGLYYLKTSDGTTIKSVENGRDVFQRFKAEDLIRAIGIENIVPQLSY